jgi:MFS family permease
MGNRTPRDFIEMGRTGSPVPPDAPAVTARPAVKIVALAAGFVMASLDTTVVNVAGARIQQDLALSVTELTWVVDGYVLTFAALLLLAGGMANRLGSLRVYLWGMAVFVAASLACAVAPNGVFLIGARLVQGAGAALFMPSSLALLVQSFPDTRQRTKILGLWSAIVATASGIGPTVGGIMVSAFGWPSIFLINLPIGLLGAVLTWRYITPAARKDAPVPFGGHLLAIAVVAAMCFALIEGPEQGWLAPAILIAYTIAVASTVALIFRERRAASHVLPWELFRLSSFAGGKPDRVPVQLRAFRRNFRSRVVPAGRAWGRAVHRRAAAAADDGVLPHFEHRLLQDLRPILQRAVADRVPGNRRGFDGRPGVHLARDAVLAAGIGDGFGEHRGRHHFSGDDRRSRRRGRR